jgi:surface polysaccharide O-acyltransferase-like enzyme
VPRTDVNPEERASTPRIGFLDPARVVAALGVIWIHTPEIPSLERTTLLCRFAVPFFACAAGYFGATSPRVGRSRDLERRTRRLYGMFLAWSALYALTRLTAAVVLGSLDRFSLPPLVDLLTSGSTHHLWFLPFAVFVSVAAALARRPPPLASIACLLALALVAFALPRPEGVPAAYFLALARDNFPAALVGIALGLAVPDRQRLGSILRPFAMPAALFTGLGLALEFTMGRAVIVENLLGTSVFIAAAGAPARVHPTARTLGELTLGVYLMHVLFVEGLQDIAHAVLRLPASPTLDVSVFAISALSSFALAKVLLRWPQTRWLVT